MNALESLDTLIAFVTILTICSMFVLIVVQMVSAALSLRGKNMANALAQTFKTVAPELNEKAHQLAQRILSDPLLSDSAWKDKQHDATGDATRTTQWSALSLSRDAVKLANAIRPEEVLAALRKLAALKEPAEVAADATPEQKKAAQVAKDAWQKQKPLCDAAVALLKATGVPGTVAEDKLSALSTVVESLGKLLPSLSDSDDLTKQVQTAIAAASGKLISAVQTVEHQVTDWLNSAQDRAQQWFQTHVRNITIAASILFAFICQIDAVDMFRHVSTDAKAREALVNASAKLVAEGGDVLDDRDGLPARVANAWNEKNSSLKLDENSVWRQVSEVESEARKKMPGNAAFKSTFESAVSAATKSFYEDKEKRLKGLEETFKTTGFDIFPAGGRRWNKEDTGCVLCDGHYWAHFFGMLLFAGLLSLGAPYWFNLLKNLASLRPALSKLIGEEQKANTTGK